MVDLIMRKLWRNVGWVDKDHTIIRSGQPSSKWKLSVLYQIFPFKSVINISWSPEVDDDDRDEYRFCLKKNIEYHHFSWGAGIPDDPKWDWVWEEFEAAVALIDVLKKPLWIHCEGGKDRTGGVVAAWKLSHNYPLDEIFADFCTYGIPNVSWLNYLWRR